MAARAHVIRDYSFVPPSDRPRRQVWIQDDDDEVVLPRGRGNHVSGALVFSAVLATALVGGLAYGVYWAAPPQLAETPSIPLEKTFAEDPLVGRANMVRALTGPALATPPAPLSAEPMTQEPTGEAASETPALGGESARRDNVVLDDSAPGFQESLPQPSADEPSRTQPALTQPQLPEPVMPRKEAPSGSDSQPVYPPTTTPPEMVEPPSLGEPGLPRSDADNPY